MTTTISHTSRIHSMKYIYSTKDEKEYIVSGSEDKTIRIWDTNSGECLREIKGHKLRVKAVTSVTSNDKIVIASVSSDGVLKCWDFYEILQSDKQDEYEPLGEYNTKCRVTCITAHVGFSKEETTTTTNKTEEE